MYLTRYPFRSFNSPKPLFGCKFLPSILCPTREQWPPPLLSSISTINFLPEREREEELSFCYLFSSRRFSRQKIIRDLILNFSLRKIPPSISVEIIASNKNREGIPKRGTRGEEGERLQEGWWLVPSIQIYLHLHPLCTGPLAARYEQPPTPLLISSSLTNLHSTPLSQRLRSTSNIPKSTPPTHPRGNSLLRNSSIRDPFCTALSRFNGRCLRRFVSKEKCQGILFFIIIYHFRFFKV